MRSSFLRKGMARVVGAVEAACRAVVSRDPGVAFGDACRLDGVRDAVRSDPGIVALARLLWAGGERPIATKSLMRSSWRSRVPSLLRSSAATGPVGLRWYRFGATPTKGVQLGVDGKHAELVAALRSKKLTFDLDEFKALGLGELTPLHWVEVDGAFYRPRALVVGKRGSRAGKRRVSFQCDHVVGSAPGGGGEGEEASPRDDVGGEGGEGGEGVGRSRDGVEGAGVGSSQIDEEAVDGDDGDEEAQTEGVHGPDGLCPVARWSDRAPAGGTDGDAAVAGISDDVRCSHCALARPPRASGDDDESMEAPQSGDDDAVDGDAMEGPSGDDDGSALFQCQMCAEEPLHRVCSRRAMSATRGKMGDADLCASCAKSVLGAEETEATPSVEHSSMAHVSRLVSPPVPLVKRVARVGRGPAAARVLHAVAADLRLFIEDSQCVEHAWSSGSDLFGAWVALRALLVAEVLRGPQVDAEGLDGAREHLDAFHELVEDAGVEDFDLEEGRIDGRHFECLSHLHRVFLHVASGGSVHTSRGKKLMAPLSAARTEAKLVDAVRRVVRTAKAENADSALAKFPLRDVDSAGGDDDEVATDEPDGGGEGERRRRTLDGRYVGTGFQIANLAVIGSERSCDSYKLVRRLVNRFSHKARSLQRFETSMYWNFAPGPERKWLRRRAAQGALRWVGAGRSDTVSPAGDAALDECQHADNAPFTKPSPSVYSAGIEPVQYHWTALGRSWFHPQGGFDSNGKELSRGVPCFVVPSSSASPWRHVAVRAKFGFDGGRVCLPLGGHTLPPGVGSELVAFDGTVHHAAILVPDSISLGERTPAPLTGVAEGPCLDLWLTEQRAQMRRTNCMRGALNDVSDIVLPARGWRFPSLGPCGTPGTFRAGEPTGLLHHSQTVYRAQWEDDVSKGQRRCRVYAFPPLEVNSLSYLGWTQVQQMMHSFKVDKTGHCGYLNRLPGHVGDGTRCLRSASLPFGTLVGDCVCLLHERQDLVSDGRRLRALHDRHAGGSRGADISSSTRQGRRQAGAVRERRGRESPRPDAGAVLVPRPRPRSDAQRHGHLHGGRGSHLQVRRAAGCARRRCGRGGPARVPRPSAPPRCPVQVPALSSWTVPCTVRGWQA